MSLKSQIFISHSSKDDKTAGEICNILEKQGFTCCMDHRDFRPGKDFDQEILDGIDNSSAFILLLSSNSNDSFQVKREVQLAADCGREDWIFPVRIENVEPSRRLKFFLSLKHWTDAFEEPLEVQLNDLIENLREFLKIEKPVKDIFYLHFQKAQNYKKDDPEVSSQYIEKAAEGVCRKIISDLGLSAAKLSPDKMKLDDILKILSDSKKISEHILIPLGIIQSFNNYIKKESEKEMKFLTEDYLAPSIDALSTVINWYYADFRKSINKTDKPESDAETYPEYDLVLCYSKDDHEWAEKNIYQILLKSKTPDGHKPKILQVCNNNSEVNENTLITDTLSIIRGSVKVVFLLSESFFNGNLGRSVLAKTIQLDPEGKNDVVVPILHPGFSESKIPIGYLNISPIYYDSKNWISSITERLGLIPLEISVETTLQFEGKINDSFVTKNLEEVKIVLSNRNEQSFEECEVKISSDKHDLNGTLKRKTKDGVAAFDDLYFLTADKEIILRASSTGYKDAISNKFNISSFNVKNEAGSRTVSEIILPDNFSEILITKNGEKAVTFHSAGISILDIKSSSVSTQKINGKLKVVDNYDNYIVLAEWGGKIYLLKSEKDLAEQPIPENEYIYQIPANSALDNNSLFIAYWNGYIYKLIANGRFESILKHSTGIQCFTHLNDAFHICDMDGMLYSYHDNGNKYINQIERNILGMYGTSAVVIIIGENKIYHYSPSKNIMISEKSGLDSHKSVYFDKNFFAIVDTYGKGAVLDYEFIKLNTFFSAKGSEIIFIDGNKEFFILQYPNNTRVLLKNNKVAFSSNSGPFILDRKCEKMFVGNQNTLKIYDRSYIDKIAQT